MGDRRQTQIVNALLEILKTLLAGARSDDPHAKQAALLERRRS